MFKNGIHILNISTTAVINYRSSYLKCVLPYNVGFILIYGRTRPPFLWSSATSACLIRVQIETLSNQLQHDLNFSIFRLTYVCYLKKIHNKYLNYSTLLRYQTRKNSLQCPLFKLQNRVNPPKKTSTRILTFSLTIVFGQYSILGSTQVEDFLKELQPGRGASGPRALRAAPTREPHTAGSW